MIFNKTILPLTLIGYEMIIANLALRASLARSITSYPTHTHGIIVKYTIMIAKPTEIALHKDPVCDKLIKYINSLLTQQ